jgi:hypothetical protein
MNFHAAYEILLPATIAIGVLFLVAVPAGIIWTYNLSEKQRRRQAGGDNADDFILSMTRPFISKSDLLFAWVRFAVAVVLGLSLITVYAAKNTNLQQSSYDYYGPMHVRSYTIGKRQFWQSSGQTRRWVVQGSATLQLEWSKNPDDSEDSTTCLTEVIYRPCMFYGLSCDSKPCTSEEIALETDRVSECLQNVLESYNDDSKMRSMLPTRSAGDLSRTSIARDREGLPILVFPGDTSTCTVVGSSDSKGQVGSKYLPYLLVGATFIFLGVSMLLIQAILEYLHFVEQRNELSDGDTECCSVASLDEELGQKDVRLVEGLDSEEEYDATKRYAASDESEGSNVDETEESQS